MGCLRAAPFADWNEWYGAVVTIHACSFTSLSPSPSLSLCLALTVHHLRVLGATSKTGEKGKEINKCEKRSKRRRDRVRKE